MSSLGRWLVGILNAHIERHNVVVFDLDEAVTTARRDSDIADAMRYEIDRQRQLVVEAQRPCWACGSPLGFHVFHLPCCKVAPFRRGGLRPGERVP